MSRSTSWRRGEAQQRRAFGWQVLQAMNGDIRSLIQDRELYLASEDTKASQSLQGLGLVTITSRGNMNQFHFDLRGNLSDQVRNVVGLPKCKLTCSRGDAQSGARKGTQNRLNQTRIERSAGFNLLSFYPVNARESSDDGVCFQELSS